jgi:hypothetical protein
VSGVWAAQPAFTPWMNTICILIEAGSICVMLLRRAYGRSSLLVTSQSGLAAAQLTCQAEDGLLLTVYASSIAAWTYQLASCPQISCFGGHW